MGKSAVDRRKYKRHKVRCAAALQWKTGPEPLKSRTIDISDGGAMLAIPIKSVPKVSEQVKVVLALPRSTANTYMVEEVTLDARVIRHQLMEADDVIGIAIQFDPTQNLGLEV